MRYRNLEISVTCYIGFVHFRLQLLFALPFVFCSTLYVTGEHMCVSKPRLWTLSVVFTGLSLRSFLALFPLFLHHFITCVHSVVCQH